MRRKTFIYSSEKTEDFANIQVSGTKLPSDYEFIKRNWLWRSTAWFFYHAVAIPVLGIVSKLVFHTKFVNLKNVRRQLKNTGYFIYSNHTMTADGWNQQCFTCRPRKAYIVSLASTIMHSRFLGGCVTMLGAIPLPSDLHSARNFLKCIEYRLNHDQAPIVIYPEGTIWPYYTHQRPVKAGSFKYPRTFDKPVVFACTTFRKPKGLFKSLKKPRIVIYLSDPIFPSREKVEKMDETRLQQLYTEFIEKWSSIPENYAANDFIPQGSKEEEDYLDSHFEEAAASYLDNKKAS